jgi:hypothetical protein
MGEAVIRKVFESKEVAFDFTAPKMAISAGDHRNFSITSPEDHVSQAAKLAIRHVISAAYPQGMAIAESEHWELLQEFVNSDVTIVSAGLTLGEVEWLRRTIEKDGLKIDTALVQWVCALLRYLKQLKMAAEAQGQITAG